MKAGTSKLQISIFSFNINGVKNKFENLANIFQDQELWVIIETHFKVRYKCPDGFRCVARSTPLNLHEKRCGGVIIYQNIHSSIALHLLNVDFLDCAICLLKDFDILLVGMYIPPVNSIYYKKDYFNQLEIILHHYKLKKVILVGYLNQCKIWSAPHYRQNPDVTLNNHGRKLIKICNLHGFHIVNGLDSECDTKFTWFKGKLRSQKRYLCNK